MSTDDDRKRAPISVILIVRNEAKKIRSCLESVSWADEIVVVDQTSTDETVDVCKEYTDKIFIVPAKGYADPDRKFAAENTINEWILYIDGDEVISEELKEEIRRLLSSGPLLDNYYILRKNYLLGKWIRGSGWHPNYIMRFFKKDKVDFFSGEIHVDVKPLGKTGYLKGEMFHYSYDTISQYTEKLDRYTTILANQAYARGKRVMSVTFFYDFFILPLWYFFKKLIIKRGYIDGFRGLLIAVFTFYTIFLMNAKIWEIENTIGKR